MINDLLSYTVDKNASDLHLSVGNIPMVRIDGKMNKLNLPEMDLKSMEQIRDQILTNDQKNMFNDRLEIDFSTELEQKGRFRVNFFNQINGISAVFRTIPNVIKNSEELGIPPLVNSLAMKDRGLILLTGPTGSGKSTTLYASLMEIMNENINITTVEDPVEYQIDGINQIHVREAIGLTFSSSLRSILRQDPDILLIGEIRDAETADIAVKFSLTGHLVFSTVHANDAPSTITRLLDLGIAPFLLGSSLNLIMAQRLVRTIDENAKEEYTPTPQELARVNLSSQDVNSMKFFRGRPTTDTHQTGYKGRTAIHEILEVNNDMRQLIYDGASQNKIKDLALKNGMSSLREAGIEKVKTGISTIDEVLRATVEDI